MQVTHYDRGFWKRQTLSPLCREHYPTTLNSFIQLFIYFLSLDGFCLGKVMGRLLEPVSAAYGLGRVNSWMRSQLHPLRTRAGENGGLQRQGRSTRVSLRCVSMRHSASGIRINLIRPSHWEMSDSSALLFTAVSNIITLCSSHSSRQLLRLRNQIPVKTRNFRDVNRFKPF